MSKSYENIKIKPNIRTTTIFQVPKMEDYYLGVQFRYPGKIWNGCIPLKAKYQGVSVPDTYDDVVAWVLDCYEQLDPGKNGIWQAQQRTFWEGKNALDTQAVFDALNGDDTVTRWLCRKCGPVPAVNPQPGARIRSLRMDGYFIATTKLQCGTCGGAQYFDLLIRLPRTPAENQKRFSLSVALTNKIKRTLPLKDACFETPLKSSEVIIDHKFPSSRWVQGETVNETDMSEAQIRRKFQILTNQTNLQKERYCQRCVLNGIRGDFFGIKWYYQGDEHWAGTSKADENGCVGCPWYDLLLWKQKFNEELGKHK